MKLNQTELIELAKQAGFQAPWFFVDELAKFAQLLAEQQQGEAISYVQNVPEHCDRIIWKGRYYHLPLTPPEQSIRNKALEEAKQMCERKKAHAEAFYGVAEGVGADLCIRGMESLIFQAPQEERPDDRLIANPYPEIFDEGSH